MKLNDMVRRCYTLEFTGTIKNMKGSIQRKMGIRILDLAIELPKAKPRIMDLDLTEDPRVEVKIRKPLTTSMAPKRISSNLLK